MFSYSTANRLEQLQHLAISRCPLLEEIVTQEGEMEGDATFVFLRLASLELDWLPELRAFYPGIHTLKCPMLTKLNVLDCDKLKNFSLELFSFQKNKPLLLFEKVRNSFSNLVCFLSLLYIFIAITIHYYTI